MNFDGNKGLCFMQNLLSYIVAEIQDIFKLQEQYHIHNIPSNVMKNGL